MRRLIIGHQNIGNISGKIVRCSAVYFKRIIDVTHIRPFPYFPGARYVYFDKCNDGTIFYWCNKEVFPDLKYAFTDTFKPTYPLLCGIPSTVLFHLIDKPSYRRNTHLKKMKNIRYLSDKEMSDILSITE